MKCSKCGHDNRAGAKFYEECAAPVALPRDNEQRLFEPESLGMRPLAARCRQGLAKLRDNGADA